MRDILTIPLNEAESIVVSTDNSGAIGMKPDDIVKVPYDIVAYFSFRVAVMESMAVRAKPFSVVIHNFCDDESWELLMKGVQKGISELGLSSLPIIGSTESNFPLRQSAIGMTVLGKVKNEELKEPLISSATRFAVIGRPLVGIEVMEQKHLVAPLSLFKWMCEYQGVTHVMPIGSKGILYKLKKLNPKLEGGQLNHQIDLAKSAGPSTCFLIAYDEKSEEEIIKKAGAYFQRIY
jgi:hypothetical protein